MSSGYANEYPFGTIFVVYIVCDLNFRFKAMKSDDIISAIKAARKAAREQEIALYGKTICHNYVTKNPKAYTRKVKHKKNTLL